MFRRGQSRPAKGTDGSLLASLPWTLGAVGFSIGPHIPYLPLWITISFSVCAGARYLIERRRKHLPPAWIRVVLAFGCFIGIIAVYDNVTGVGPGSALLIIMAGLKLLETRQRRDQFVLLFISIFLIMSSLLREQFLWSAPFLVIGVLITLTAWLQMSVSPETNAASSAKSAVRLMLYAVPLTLAMWIFFPRLSNPFWAIPVDLSSAQSGLSDTMSPGDISSLSLSNEVAFRVDFEGEVPPPPQLYWRGLVLDRFNGRTWTGNDIVVRDATQVTVEYIGKPVLYQITLEPTSQHWVYALDVPYEWSLGKTAMGRQQQLIRQQAIDQRTSFGAVSYTRFRIDSARIPGKNDPVRSLPQRSNKRAYALAQRMRASADSNEDYVEDVLHMFHTEEFYYTLEPPALGRNPVDRFLFDTRQGFCEHYASAFAVMMRAVGIPSRIVLGYQGGELNPLGNYLIVRQSDAHAWNEIWLAGRGWTRIDPTAAVAPERIAIGISGVLFGSIGASWGFAAPSMLLHKLNLTWDALNAKWNDWVLGYGPENQNRLMEWLGMEDPDWRQMLLTLLAIVVALVVLISAMLVLRYQPPKKDEAALLFAKFTSRTGIVPVIGETPRAYAERLHSQGNTFGELAGEVVEQYLETRYGPPQPLALQQLKDTIASVLARLKKLNVRPALLG